MHETPNIRQNPAKPPSPLDGMVGRRSTDLAFYSDSKVLVYLIHGVTGTPTEMRYLGRGLARHKWDVYATTLPGHGTRLRDLLRTNDHDWLEHIKAQLAFARDRYDYVFVAGLSAGGLLALEASAFVGVDGVGVLSPTFIYDGWNTPWTHAILPLAMKWIPRPLQSVFFHVDGPPFGIKDERLQARMRESYSPISLLREWLRACWARRKNHAADNRTPASSAATTGYPVFPLKTFTDLDRLNTRVRSRLRAVTAPTVILQALEDDLSSPRNAQIVHDEISSREKRVVLLEDCYHVITVDKQRHSVVAALAEFFGAQLPKEKPAQRHHHLADSLLP